eukprot:COSAG02_NODE_1290_length_13442_cov_6.479125_1_plen_438_part_00
MLAGLLLLSFANSCIMATASNHAAAGEESFVVSFTEHSSTPVISTNNTKGNGSTPCMTLNPSYIPASAGLNQSGLLLRMCCGENVFCNNCGSGTCNGRHPHGTPAPSYPFPFNPSIPERITFAPCDLATGLCGDVDTAVNLDPTVFAEDPRAFLYNGWYYNFYWRGKPGSYHPGKCTLNVAANGSATELCGVALAKTQTPLNSSSWQIITYLPWVRNGCCHMKPKGQKSYCLFGSGPDGCPNQAFMPPEPKIGCAGYLSGIGIAYTEDIDSGIFHQVSWSVAAGVHSPVTPDSMWMSPLGIDHAEVHLEAGAAPQLLSNGDLLHFYAGMTPGFGRGGNWTGNYTAGWIVLDGKDPSKIVGRWNGAVPWFSPTFDYETLCRGAADCKFVGENPNTIFLSSATATGRVKDEFRLWYGAGDGNVGTAVVQVTIPLSRRRL